VNARNDFVAAVLLVDGVFSAAECEAIRDRARSIAPSDVGVYPAPAIPIRSAVTRLMELDGWDAWIARRLLEAARGANASFRFEVGERVEPLMHVAYPVGGHFDWHTDLGDGAEASRKLSLSVQLTSPSAYQGGALHILSHEEALERGEQGCLTIFPAHLAHRVTPVTRGEREALVSWLHGPSFR
jgi:PKHD-type hydroxylase